MMTRKSLSPLSLLALVSVLACGLMWPAAVARQAQTTTDNEIVPIAGTVLDCAGNPVELVGEMHILTHTTISSSGQFNMVAHLNQQLEGTSADGTRHVMNQQLQDVFTGDASDGFPLTQTFEIHSNLNNNDPGVPQLHIRAILHVTFNANGEITGTQLVIKEECEGS